MAPALTDVAEGARNPFVRDSSLKPHDYKPAASSVLKLQFLPGPLVSRKNRNSKSLTGKEMVLLSLQGVGHVGRADMLRNRSRRQESSLNKATTAGLIFRQTELVVIRRSLRDRCQFADLLITPI